MKEFSWSVNSVLKSASFESRFAPSCLRPASATSLLLSTCSLVLSQTLDVGDMRFAGCILSGYRVRDLVESHFGVGRLVFEGFLLLFDEHKFLRLQRRGVFLCRLALAHSRKLSFLANCIFADRILSEYGVCELFERSLVWNGLISTGFCFCLVNMSFCDRSDFTFCAKWPSNKENPLPYVLSWMQVCAS